MAFITSPVPIVGSTTLVDADVGDLNLDGITDVVSTHRNINPYSDPNRAPDLSELRFWWGNAMLDTSDRLDMTEVQYPFYVDVIDLEGDGTDELAVSIRHDDVTNCGIIMRDPILLGGFNTLGRLPADLSQDCRFAIGRLNDDNLVDLVTSAEPFVYISVDPGSNGVMIVPSTSRPPIATAHYGIDLDCSEPPGTIDHCPLGLRVWRQKSPMEFQVESEFTATNVNSHSVGDLNHDGDQDIVVCSESGVDLYLGAAGTSFAAGVSLALGDCDDTLIHDLNGDGGNDLAYLTSDNTVSFLINAI